MEEEQVTNFNDFIAQFIHECETGKRKKKEKLQIYLLEQSKATKAFNPKFKAYQEIRLKVIDFEDLTIEFYNDFRSFLTDKEYLFPTLSPG